MDHDSPKQVEDCRSLTPAWKILQLKSHRLAPGSHLVLLLLSLDNAYLDRDMKTGLPIYRGYTVDKLWTSDFEDLFHLMVFEKYPSPTERESLRKSLEQDMMNVPGVVVDTIRSFPYENPLRFVHSPFANPCTWTITSDRQALQCL